jgi:ABC-type lipoprotein release transport system permease subunit
MSEGLAERLKVIINDTVFLIGQGYHGTTSAGRFVVQGILKFASPDLNDQLIYMNISSAMELYSAPGISTTAVISLKNPKLLDLTVSELQNQLGSDYEVKSWETILPEIKQHIETDSNSMKYIQGILYMLVSFGIFGTLLMMMLERNYEMAMLIAIGMKKSRLYLMIVIESVLTVSGGCVTGLIVSIPVVWYFNRHPLRMSGEIAEIYEKFGFEAVFPTSVAPENFIFQGVFVLVLGLILSFYPVYKVWKMDPVTSLKK